MQIDTSNVLARELLASRHDFIIAPHPRRPQSAAVREPRDRRREGLPDRAARSSADRPARRSPLDRLGRLRLGVPARRLAAAPNRGRHIPQQRNARCRTASSTPSSLLLTLVMVAQSDAIAPVSIEVAKFIQSADGAGRRHRHPADRIRYRRPALQPDQLREPGCCRRPPRCSTNRSCARSERYSTLSR